jgi:hypothetical protein
MMRVSAVFLKLLLAGIRAPPAMRVATCVHEPSEFFWKASQGTSARQQDMNICIQNFKFELMPRLLFLIGTLDAAHKQKWRLLKCGATSAVVGADWRAAEGDSDALTQPY